MTKLTITTMKIDSDVCMLVTGSEPSHCMASLVKQQIIMDADVESTGPKLLSDDDCSVRGTNR